MIKKVTNRLSILLGTSLILLLCVLAIIPMKAKAEAGNPPPEPDNFAYILYSDLYPGTGNYDREFGVWNADEIPGNTCHGHLCDYFGTSGRKHFLVEISVKNTQIGELFLYDRDGDDFVGDVFATKENFKCQYDKTTKTYNYSYAVVTENSIDCCIYNYSNKKIKYEIRISAEPEMVLSKTTISQITNTKSRTMTVKYAAVKKRLGYQIEYATDSKFKNKARVNTGATTKDIGKLTKGKTYYVRVRIYARYDDGSLTYSKWSGTKKIKITK